MRYFDRITEAYEESVRRSSVQLSFSLMPLDHWENAVTEIAADIMTDSAQISIGKGSGVRRSATLSLYDRDGRYTPDKNSFFWYNRKFKLVALCRAGADEYLFSQGVYILSGAALSNGRLTLSAVDKYANLSGETNVGKVIKPFSTDISAGTIYVADLIRETLLKDIGNGTPIDPVPPLIDPFFGTAPLYADISLSEGQYYGEIISRLADMYGADAYYNARGQLVFCRKPTYSQPSWYMHMGYLWQYRDRDETVEMSTASASYSFDSINCVTVATDNTEGEVFSYTAKNKNSESPVNVRAIGERYTDPPVKYISVGDTTSGSPEQKCREYAEYLLLQNTRSSVSQTFSSIYIPHFEVERVIRYRDEDYVIDQIDADLTSRRMTVKASNVNFLPTNWSVQSYE